MNSNHKIFFKGLFYGLGLMVIIINLFYFSYLYGVAYHNLDLSQNMKYLEAEFDLDLVDYSSNGNYLSYIELWHTGSKQLRKSFIGILFIGLASGLYMSLVIFNVLYRHKNETFK